MVFHRGRRQGGGACRRRFCSERELRQAEVQNLGLAAVGNENVGRLDVAMHDTLGVCHLERIGDLDS